ncbi:DUF342 domain-containing protein [Pectinatus haikarae]|uniref:Uncharacterized protein (DUF342 family) n=1 Tax=Pectinatus haikarae TaxID=349096 RepID=A0ABT9Y7D5_9FIRM|nr:FapA family protein [Pectinatus haikarae]MDQ0203751.1 uncharacterized protein (DUF342 family) [Pectinatus haikarae]
MSDIVFGSEKEGFLLEILSEGVFLTIYVPKENSPFFKDVTLLCALLKKHGIKNYKITDLLKTIQEHSGVRSEIVAPEAAQEKVIPVPVIDISKDKMEAVISFSGDDGEFQYDRDYIMELLADKNITYGIDKALIDEFVKVPSCSQVIAQGKIAKNGENAYIKKYIDFSQKGRPSSGNYGKVNYKDMNLCFLVAKGDPLAERIPQTKGENGMNIMGQEIICRPGKPIPLTKGKNTEIIDENLLIAAIDGQAIEEGNRITVDPKLEISSDVDVSTGNINFNGSVFIKGNVQDGFSVRADGDVHIGGTVSGGTVEARNIYIEGGILGMRRGKIYAREDIRTNFIENADITAERDIYIADVALHSEINAGRKIIIKDRRGQVVGGHSTAGVLIDVKILGNFMDIVTKVEVGVNPIINKKYRLITDSIGNDKKQLKNIKNALNMLGTGEKLSAERQEKFARLKRMQFPLAGKLEREEAELKEISGQLKSMDNAKIRVSDKVNPGVKIIVAKFLYTVQTEAQHCSFSADVKRECVSLNPY